MGKQVVSLGEFKVQKKVAQGFIYCYDCSTQLCNHCKDYVFMTNYRAGGGAPQTIVLCHHCNENNISTL